MSDVTPVGLLERSYLTTALEHISQHYTVPSAGVEGFDGLVPDKVFEMFKAPFTNLNRAIATWMGQRPKAIDVKKIASAVQRGKLTYMGVMDKSIPLLYGQLGETISTVNHLQRNVEIYHEFQDRIETDLYKFYASIAEDPLCLATRVTPDFPKVLAGTTLEACINSDQVHFSEKMRSGVSLFKTQYENFQQFIDVVEATNVMVNSLYDSYGIKKVVERINKLTRLIEGITKAVPKEKMNPVTRKQLASHVRVIADTINWCALTLHTVTALALVLRNTCDVIEKEIK